MTSYPKVIHLISGRLSGGAARGAYWLHRGLLECGVDSTVLTNSRENLNDSSVIQINYTLGQRVKSALLLILNRMLVGFYPKRKHRVFNTGIDGVDFTSFRAYQEADIVHLHWINGLVSLRMLSKINKPIVWTIRDMWPLTGGCHYSMECDRYKTGCGKCMQLSSNSIFDLSKYVVRKKRNFFPKHIHVVGISHWLSSCAKQSFLFNGYSIQTIFNNIDTNEFSPINKEVAREALGLPHDKKIVLVVAQDLSDFYKGFDLFLESITKIIRDDIHLVFVGNETVLSHENLRYGHTNLGFLNDTISLNLAYSAAHVFVAASRMEAFGKTLCEAMACGTPVVCFDATGPMDIVQHKLTGYKAQPFDSVDLARGIEWVLNSLEADYLNLVKSARERVVTMFDSRIAARQYKKLYTKLLAEKCERTMIRPMA